jgi:hypothetical protein
MKSFRAIATLVAWLLLVRGVSAQDLKVGAAALELEASDSMIIGGGIGPGKAKGQEGSLRAAAVVIEDQAGVRVALVACDVLMIERDVLDRAARRIESETKIPFDHILINATHTHHAPTTVTVHGYDRDQEFTRQVADKIVAAAAKANSRRQPANLSFRLGEESSVGKNSRLLLADGSIYWTGPRDDAVRPTGPFDPELPVLAFHRRAGGMEAILFNHSTHTIGTLKPGVRSPSFYGLAAQKVEKETGATVLFFEGASGSTHNLDVTMPEAVYRIEHAVRDALASADRRPVASVDGIRREVTVRYRQFDEAVEDLAVETYCGKRYKDKAVARFTIETFRRMRATLADRRGRERKTWVQAIVIGDIAFVGVPGEFFTFLGQEIKRRSPYRFTYVFELANDYVGYIPDKVSYDRGGYQVWTGLHSYLERGTGEKIVDVAVELLDKLASRPPRAPAN